MKTFRTFKNSLHLAAALGALSAVPAGAAVINSAWEGHKVEDYCYAISFPTAERPSYGDRYLTVTERPDQKIRNEIAVVSGYGRDASVEGSMSIDGGLPIKLLVYEGTGFLKSTDLEAQAVAQMRRGRSLEVKWTAENGSYVVDTYSLMGFTATSGYVKNCK